MLTEILAAQKNPLLESLIERKSVEHNVPKLDNISFSDLFYRMLAFYFLLLDTPIFESYKGVLKKGGSYAHQTVQTLCKTISIPDEISLSRYL